MFHLFSVYINITQFKIKENIISSDYFSKGNEGFSKDIYAAFSWRKSVKIITEKPLFWADIQAFSPNQPDYGRSIKQPFRLVCEPHHSLAARLACCHAAPSVTLISREPGWRPPQQDCEQTLQLQLPGCNWILLVIRMVSWKIFHRKTTIIHQKQYKSQNNVLWSEIALVLDSLFSFFSGKHHSLRQLPTPPPLHEHYGPGKWIIIIYRKTTLSSSSPLLIWQLVISYICFHL